MTCCTLNTWILTYKLLTSLCPVALFLSMVRSKQGTQTPRFLKCYSAVLLFPVKIVSQILQALQFTWHNEDKLLARNPEVLENWISGSSKKEKTTPQNSKSNNSIYWSYPMRQLFGVSEPWQDPLQLPGHSNRYQKYGRTEAESFISPKAHYQDLLSSSNQESRANRPGTGSPPSRHSREHVVG